MCHHHEADAWAGEALEEAEPDGVEGEDPLELETADRPDAEDRLPPIQPSD